MNQPMNPQNTLQQIFDYAYPANHLLRISIVKDTSTVSAKSPYFALISLIPGVTDPNTGNRTYDSQSKITMKQSILHLLAIAKCIRRLCNEQNQNFIGSTSFMTDASRSAFGGNDQKMLFISRQADKNNNMVISIGLKVGQAPARAINISPGVAEALADLIEIAAHETMKMELKESVERASMYRQQLQQNPGQRINNQPTPQTPPFLNNVNNQAPTNNNINTNVAPEPSPNTLVTNFQETLSNQQFQSNNGPTNSDNSIPAPDVNTLPEPPF